MTYQIILSKQAKLDLSELKDYITINFSKEIWRRTYSKIKDAINNLKFNPFIGGSLLSELSEISSNQYRQAISGMNCIIYDVRKDTVYIHIIADSRRDLSSLLNKRLLRKS